MDARNIPNPMSKKLTNPGVYCPWTSSAPFSSNIGSKNSACEMVLPNKNGTLYPKSTNPQIVINNCQQDTKCPITKKQDTPIQQSSNHFFHFLRLMQLFPDVHPATLHTVMTLCQNNFFAAVDKLLYAKKCKEVYNNRKTAMQQYASTSRRYQPYCCSNHSSRNSAPTATSQNCATTATNTPLLKPTLLVTTVNRNIQSAVKIPESSNTAKPLETKKIVLKNSSESEKIPPLVKIQKKPIAKQENNPSTSSVIAASDQNESTVDLTISEKSDVAEVTITQ